MGLQKDMLSLVHVQMIGDQVKCKGFIVCPLNGRPLFTLEILQGKAVQVLACAAIPNFQILHFVSIVAGSTFPGQNVRALGRVHAVLNARRVFQEHIFHRFLGSQVTLQNALAWQMNQDIRSVGMKHVERTVSTRQHTTFPILTFQPTDFYAAFRTEENVWRCQALLAVLTCVVVVVVVVTSRHDATFFDKKLQKTQQCWTINSTNEGDCVFFYNNDNFTLLLVYQ
jgi:hypothetical protein